MDIMLDLTELVQGYLPKFQDEPIACEYYIYRGVSCKDKRINHRNCFCEFNGNLQWGIRPQYGYRIK